MDVFPLLNISRSWPTGQTLIQIPQGDRYSFLSLRLRVAQLTLSIGGGKSAFSSISRASTGQFRAQERQWVHRSSPGMVFPSSSRVVNILVKRILGPQSGVKRTLLNPNDPNPPDRRRVYGRKRSGVFPGELQYPRNHPGG